jgi:hypothetical protein
MLSAKTIERLESPENQVSYILGTRMRKVKQIRDRLLSHPGRYKVVWPQNSDRKKPAPLTVKQVDIEGHRYVVCVNPAQQRKDAADRQAIVAALTEQLKKRCQEPGGQQGLSKVPEG